jgi:hypothetical protein
MIFMRNAKDPQDRILESIDYMFHRPDFQVNHACGSNLNMLFYSASHGAPLQSTKWLLELGCNVHCLNVIGRETVMHRYLQNLNKQGPAIVWLVRAGFDVKRLDAVDSKKVETIMGTEYMKVALYVHHNSQTKFGQIPSGPLQSMLVNYL